MMTHLQILFFISKTTSFTFTVEIAIGGCKFLRFNEMSFDMYTQK